jgi:hypothetical protein
MRKDYLWQALVLRSGLKLLTLADIVLVIIILISAAGSYYILHKQKSGLSAYIYYRNTLFGVFPLNKDQVIEITESCSAEISSHKIRMLKADCPDKRCVHQGWSTLLPIICLPNQIVIEVKADKQKQQMHILQ